MLEFFKTGEMLKGVNSTIIALIPKGSHVDSIGDYGPIPCCNTVYKLFKNVMLETEESIT